MEVFGIVFGLAYWVLPVLLGYLATRFRPQWAWWKCGLVAGAPFAALLLAVAIWIGLTSDISTCAEPPCQNMAPLFFWGLLAGSAFTLGLGFGLGMVGRALAPTPPSVKGQ